MRFHIGVVEDPCFWDVFALSFGKYLLAFWGHCYPSKRR